MKMKKLQEKVSNENEKKSFLKLLRSQAKVQKIQFFFYYFLFVYPHKNQAQMIGRYGWNLTI